MVVVKGMSKLRSFDVRGAIGNYAAWKRGELTWEECEARNALAGIYQLKGAPGRRVLSKSKFYRPSNPRTPPQQNWRAIFRAGVLLWQGLTPDARTPYNEEARRLRMSGFNLFMREWLNAFR